MVDLEAPSMAMVDLPNPEGLYGKPVVSPDRRHVVFGWVFDAGGARKPVLVPLADPTTAHEVASLEHFDGTDPGVWLWTPDSAGLVVQANGVQYPPVRDESLHLVSITGFAIDLGVAGRPLSVLPGEPDD